MTSPLLTFPLITLSSLALPFAASAQETIPKEVTADKALAAPAPETPQGWAFKLTVGATGSYGHSSNVVGSVDGSTVQLGLLMAGSANLTMGRSSWENGLKLSESQTRTPQLQSFIKSTDELALQSTYLYHPAGLDWVGPFARAAATTAVFRSYDVRTTDVTIVRTFRDGTSKTNAIPAGDHIQLAKPFEPVLLKEGVGAFANPYTDTLLSVKTKAGFAMQHVLVRDGFAIADEAATPELEIKQMKKSTQAGGEAEVELAGKMDGNITWGAKANVFYPIYTSVQTDLEGIDLMSTDLSAKISVRLAEWASLDYVLSAKRIPLILEEWQVQNNVLLTAGFDII